MGLLTPIDIADDATILALIIKGGIIVAAGSPVCMGSSSASQPVKKIIEINQYTLVTVSGGVTGGVARDLYDKCRQYELENKRRISIEVASELLAQISYSYGEMGLPVATIIAGWDEMGPGLYHVDNRVYGTMTGTRFCVGSGSPPAYGEVDRGYCYSMSIDEAAELARRAIYHATCRDGAAGGDASVYYVGPNGWEKLSGDDIVERQNHSFPITLNSMTPTAHNSALDPDSDSPDNSNHKFAQFGAGPFWGAEPRFQRLAGVIKTEVGYSQGHVPDPDYMLVHSGTTNHVEVVRVQFDPQVCSYTDLLSCFWSCHDSTPVNYEGIAVKTQYRSGIYYYNETQADLAKELKESKEREVNKKIATEILPAKRFFMAEEYHQQCIKKLFSGFGSASLKKIWSGDA
ncbi:proteasome subunit beta type-5-A-like [Neltuma alba]|uniref:proteasome subunit beta type-5-A-like n=1 Tax=Neltuma alba TaxID=207710 RepID=UPI0010A2C577|nr:proteasome subunit beta type-5-A-like [Prosopis alba]